MILVSEKMYTKCWTFENISCFESVWCVFARMFILKVRKQLRTFLSTQKSFVHFSLFLLILLSYHWLVRSLIFECKRTGVGHRIVMITMLWDILAFLFEGLRSFLKATLIASLRDYDLFVLIAFAKIPSMHTMAILRQQSGWNPKSACVQGVVIFHAFLSCIRSCYLFWFLSYHTNPNLLSWYMKAIKCVK